MNFVLKPSLEHMALVKIVTSLWNQNDVRTLISKLSVGDLSRRKEWKPIEEIVIQKVAQLSLPHLLNVKVLGFIKPIGLQILEWMEFHCMHFDLLLNLPPELCWTPQGTVDRKRTVEALVKDENLNMSTRCRLACIYCLEDDIILLWNRMSDDFIESASYRFQEINFWSRIMRTKGSHISYKDDFFTCACWYNKVAAEYFLQKLTPTERKESLVEAAKYVSDVDTLCFLISEMDEETQINFFRRRPDMVLKSFLEWPRQSFFLEIANCMWDFLSKKKFECILINIVRKVRDGYKDCNYQTLFREFWQKSPNALKSLITNEIDTSRLLPYLFNIKDKENSRLILKDTTFKVNEKLIYSYTMNGFCERSIRKNEWDFLEFSIRECFPSKNQMLKFKKEFEKDMCPIFKEYHFSTKKPKWDLLFSFSDDFICKRSLEEGESSSSKQFRSLQ